MKCFNVGLPSFANGVENVAFSDATMPSHNVADVTLKKSDFWEQKLKKLFYKLKNKET
jgi:hypothetical protein